MGELSHSLTALNPDSKLHVVRGAPHTILPALWKEWKISHLVFEKDTAGYAVERDARIIRLARSAGVTVLNVMGHSLYDPELVVKANKGKSTMSVTTWHAVCTMAFYFSKVWFKYSPVGRQKPSFTLKTSSSPYVPAFSWRDLRGLSLKRTAYR